jgi:hypothetical protein
MVLERTAGKSSVIDVLDRVIDKGIVIDAWLGFSLVGIELVTVEGRMVVASIETYFKHADAVAQVTPGLLARASVVPPRAQTIARRSRTSAKSPRR